MSELTWDTLCSGHTVACAILVSHADHQDNKTARQFLLVFFPGLGGGQSVGRHQFSNCVKPVVGGRRFTGSELKYTIIG